MATRATCPNMVMMPYWTFVAHDSLGFSMKAVAVLPGWIRCTARAVSNITLFWTLSSWTCRLHSSVYRWLNTLRPRQNGRHFPNDIFKCFFMNINVWISIKISLKFVPMGLINNITALVLIMAWHRTGDRPLSEPMLVSLLAHICVTRRQWVNAKET